MLPIPHYKQLGDYNCLPACARMVLQYLNRDINEADLAVQLGATAMGTSGSRLLRLQSRTLDVFFGPFTLPLLYDTLDAGVPVIILVSTVFLDYRQDDFAHAVVVVGYTEQHILVNDPDFDNAPQQVTPTGLLAAWGEFDFLAGTITKR
ncbi:MAG TPA: C39 family peptidase [Chloroflexi bacterium]|nr:C39 family peptidase [Chloroflexota bacterium]